MSDVEVGGYAFPYSYYNAYEKSRDFHHYLDKPGKYYDKEMARDCYKEFLNERMNNPTIARIADYEYTSKHPVQYFYDYYENKHQLVRSPEIDTLLKASKKAEKEKYPKTRILRIGLINEGRFELGQVKPKITGFKKFLLRLATIL